VLRSAAGCRRRDIYGGVGESHTTIDIPYERHEKALVPERNSFM
jgi:hypothetical protein